MKYRVFGTNHASGSVDADFEDEDVVEYYGLTDDEVVDEERRQEYARDYFYDNAPTICAQCSGWGKQDSLELGDNWEIEEVVREDD